MCNSVCSEICHEHEYKSHWIESQQKSLCLQDKKDTLVYCLHIDKKETVETVSWGNNATVASGNEIIYIFCLM